MQQSWVGPVAMACPPQKAEQVAAHKSGRCLLQPVAAASWWNALAYRQEAVHGPRVLTIAFLQARVALRVELLNELCTLRRANWLTTTDWNDHGRGRWVHARAVLGLRAAASGCELAVVLSDVAV